MSKLKNLKLKNFFEMNDVEMKNIVGGYGDGTEGFDCGPNLIYYTGSCTNGKGFAVCATDFSAATELASAFCSSYN